MRTLLLISASLTALAAGAAQAADANTADTDSNKAQTLAPITVVATRTATPVDEVPATVTVFTAAQIEALLATDIKDLIRYEPGISVPTQPARFGAALGTTGRDGNAGFTIRGLGGDRVLIVTDGVRNADGFVFGAQSVGRGGYNDLDLVKSVEILRGPASALYGSDGVAGAVSFTTKDPEDFLTQGRDFAARAKVGYNSADSGWTESVAFAGRAGAFSGLLAYTRRDSEETETKGSVTGEELLTGNRTVYSNRTQANPQDLSSDAVLAKLVWDFADGQSLRGTYENFQSSMSADVLSGRTTVVTGATPAATAVTRLLADDTTKRERFSLDYRLKDVFGLDQGHATAYWQESKTRQYTFEDRVGVDRIRDNQFNNRVFGFAADARKTLTLAGIENRITFGGDWSKTRQEGIRDGTVPPAGETFPTSPFPRTDYTLWGVFIQDEIALLDGRLRVIPALRYDAYELSTSKDALYPYARADQDDSHLSPKLGVVWQATPSFQLFANYALGFKAPTPSQVNNGFSNLAFGYMSAPNPDLKPETSRSIEAGLRLRDQDFAFGRMAVQLVAFHSQYEDFISQEVVSGGFTPTNPAVYKFVNVSDVKVTGLEGKATIDWDNGLTFRAAAAWADGEQTTSGVKSQLSTIDPIKLVGGLGWNDPAGRFGVEGVVTWSDAKKSRDTNGLASCYNVRPEAGCYVGQDFTLVDLTGYWNVTETVTARVGVFNVFDKKYSWWSDIRGVANTSAVLDAYTQPGRNVGVSLSLRL